MTWRNLVIPLVFMVTGCLGGYILVTATNDPSRTHWEELPAPPEPAARIIELGGYGSTANRITIETASGKQYDCCGPWPSTWNSLPYNKTRYGPTCHQVESSLFDQLSAVPVDCAFISQFEWVTEHYYAALLPDGSLWSWHYYFGLPTILNATGAGALIGLIIGVGWILIHKWKSKIPGEKP